MRKIFILTAFLVCINLVVNAQTDTLAEHKNTTQMLSFQVNGLLHQITSVNNGTPTGNLNPYLLNYHITSKKSGWGVRAGAGYGENSSSNLNLNGNSSNNASNFNFRLGVEKARHISKYFSVGLGVDVIYNHSYNLATSAYNNTINNDTTSQSAKTIVNSFGGGMMGWLRLKVTHRIFLGTEASFYYTTGMREQTLDYTGYQYGSGSPYSQHYKKSYTISTGTFTEPIVIYLLLKF